MMGAFSQSLREKRKARGLSQSELAAKAGSNKQTISRYERGERDPTVATVNKLAAALQITVTELLNGIEQEAV